MPYDGNIQICSQVGLRLNPNLVILLVTLTLEQLLNVVCFLICKIKVKIPTSERSGGDLG